MGVMHIKARIQCDGCGTNFIVEMDRTKMRPKGWALEDEAVDAVRGGTYEVPRGGCHGGGQCSVQAEMCLCASCTKIVDEGTPDEPTKEQIEAVLDRKVVGAIEP